MAAGLSAAEFKPLVNLEARGGYAATEGSTSSGLGQVDFSAVPALQFGRRTWLPTVYFNAGGQERPIEEGTTFVRTASAGFKPSLVTDLGDGWGTEARVQALRNWNIESLGENWGTGIYDYDQYGAGAGLTLPKSLTGFGLVLGVDLAHRNYPNYHNIAAAAALTDNKNYYVKDFYSVAAKVTALFDWHQLCISYSPELRSYTDSYVVVLGGTTDLSKPQQDVLHAIDATCGFSLSPKLGLMLSLNGSFNDSNQASFDSASLTYIPNFQNYASETLSLTLPWALDGLWDGLQIIPAYSINLRQTQKPVQDSSGAYLSDKQADTEHDFSLNMSKTLNWGIAWVTGGSYRSVSSNQQLVRGTLNSYNYWQATTGLAYAWEGKGSKFNESAGEPQAEAAPKAEPGFESIPAASDEQLAMERLKRLQATAAAAAAKSTSSTAKP